MATNEANLPKDNDGVSEETFDQAIPEQNENDDAWERIEPSDEAGKQHAKRSQMNRRSDYENPIGLTQAFGPITVSEDGEEDDSWGRSWSNGYEDSDGWDQIVPDDDTPDDWHEPDDGAFSQEDENARRHVKPHPEHHVVMEYDELPEEELEEAAACTEFNEQAVAALAAEKEAMLHGADAYVAAKAAATAGEAVAVAEHKREEAAAGRFLGYDGDDFPDAVDSLEPKEAPAVLFDESAASDKPRAKGTRGKHAKEISVHERKAHKTRRALIVVILLVVALIAGIVYFGYHLFVTSQDVAIQQSQSSSSTSIESSTNQDATTATTKKTNVPDLSVILGKTQDEAVSLLGHGATVRSSKEVSEEGNPIKRNVTIALTDEPADTKTGTPTVYLGLNEEGKVIQAGYSTSTASLGFGSTGFRDAVINDHVIEKTLQDANIMVNEGAAVLPDDKTQYTTYGSDGTTVTRERSSFSGDVTVNNVPCTWSAVLSYDYATANQTGNLADTIRVVYVYVGLK